MTKGEARRARKAAQATDQSLTDDLALRPERNRPLAHVMLDWRASWSPRRRRVATDYWDAYESGRPMGSDDC